MPVLSISLILLFSVSFSQFWTHLSTPFRPLNQGITSLSVPFFTFRPVLHFLSVSPLSVSLGLNPLLPGTVFSAYSARFCSFSLLFLPVSVNPGTGLYHPGRPKPAITDEK